MNKVVKSTWLCFARGEVSREEVWVRGQIRPYKDGDNQYFDFISGGLIWNTSNDFEIWLQDLPQWTVGTEDDPVHVYFETEDSLSTPQRNWAVVTKVRNFTMGVRRNKMFSLVVSSSTAPYITDNSPPKEPTPFMVEALEEAERALQNTLIAANNLI